MSCCSSTYFKRLHGVTAGQPAMRQKGADVRGKVECFKYGPQGAPFFALPTRDGQRHKRV